MAGGSCGKEDKFKHNLYIARWPGSTASQMQTVGSWNNEFIKCREEISWRLSFPSGMTHGSSSFAHPYSLDHVKLHQSGLWSKSQEESLYQQWGADKGTGCGFFQIFSLVVSRRPFIGSKMNSDFTFPFYFMYEISLHLVKGCARWSAFPVSGYIMCEF